ncbi:MAG: hypothetical protein WDN04_12490 [Rhodospirillales bacterium]
MSQWDDFLSKVEAGIATVAKNAFAGYVNEAKSDAEAFLAAAKADLQTWTVQLAAGTIDRGDLTDYLKADATLAQMAALTAAGIAEADLQRFRDTLIDTVVSAAVATFKP